MPTKYNGFYARLGPGAKSRSLQGLLKSATKDSGSHTFFRDTFLHTAAEPAVRAAVKN